VSAPQTAARRRTPRTFRCPPWAMRGGGGASEGEWRGVALGERSKCDERVRVEVGARRVYAHRRRDILKQRPSDTEHGAASSGAIAPVLDLSPTSVGLAGLPRRRKPMRVTWLLAAGSAWSGCHRPAGLGRHEPRTILSGPSGAGCEMERHETECGVGGGGSRDGSRDGSETGQRWVRDGSRETCQHETFTREVTMEACQSENCHGLQSHRSS
jgi:hypothetical protein